MTVPQSGHWKRAALVPVTEIPQETQERSPVVSASLMFGKAGARRLTVTFPGRATGIAGPGSVDAAVRPAVGARPMFVVATAI